MHEYTNNTKCMNAWILQNVYKGEPLTKYMTA